MSKSSTKLVHFGDTEDEVKGPKRRKDSYRVFYIRREKKKIRSITYNLGI